MAEILIVDDDETMCSAFRHFLKSEGHTPLIVSNTEDALRTVAEKHPHIVFMDIRMPGIDGLEGLKQIRALDPQAYVIMMTAYSTSQTSIEAVRLGAFDYLHKPLDLDDVRHLIDKALAAQEVSRRAASKNTTDWERYSLVNLVGSSSRMQEIYKFIGLLTTNHIPVLIVGERGTGKQLAAQTIHFNSNRKDHPFVTVSCQTVPPENLDNEIFGSISGGVEHVGRIERANGGTLFLEEMQHLPPAAQNKLLRFLEERTYEKAGAPEPQSVDVRIIAATTRDASDYREQVFSVELYDALQLMTIELPPLRDRSQDIPELVNHFIRRHNDELNKSIRGIDDRVLDLLREHRWPGNVAELESIIKRACILARGDVITVDEVQSALEVGWAPVQDAAGTLDAAARQVLQQKLMEPDPGARMSVFHEIVEQVETALVKEALRITGGNQVKAAEILGLNRTTLRKKMNLDGAEAS